MIGTALFLIGVVLIVFSIYAVVAIPACRRRAGAQRVAGVATIGVIFLLIGVVIQSSVDASPVIRVTTEDRYESPLPPRREMPRIPTSQEALVDVLTLEREFVRVAEDAARYTERCLAPIRMQAPSVPVPCQQHTHQQLPPTIVEDERGGVTITFWGNSGMIETGVVIRQHETIEIVTPKEVKGLVVGHKLMHGARCYRNPPTPPGGIRWNPAPARDFLRLWPYTLLTAEAAVFILDTTHVSDPGPHTVSIIRVPCQVPVGLDGGGKPLRRIYTSR